MGKIFTTNTWRTPLQLIDCWLPEPSLRSKPAANEPLVSRAMQRFARAGWLGRGTRDSVSAPMAQGNVSLASASHNTGRVRVLRQAEVAQRPAGIRLVISGRISDVCAELDRLADQENLRATRAA